MSADVIDFVQSAEFMDNRLLLTKDKKFNTYKLINRIKSVAGTVTDDKRIHRFIIESFTPTGIVEVYNNVGIDEFDNIIKNMALHEFNERRTNINKTNKKATQQQ